MNDASAWTPETFQELNERFEHSSPREILKWGFETFGDDLVMATGFGPSGVVLSHLLSNLRPETTIFYLETDLLFLETYALRNELSERLGLSFTMVRSNVSLEQQTKEHGPRLWANEPNTCCFIRKVLPLRRFLADKKAWITGVRRDQSASRADTDIVGWDETNGLVKLNPLATWTNDEIWQYIHLHELPYNRLHDMGYPSVGCMPCTRPIAPDEDVRAGRWTGFNKTECGIHVNQHAA